MIRGVGLISGVKYVPIAPHIRGVFWDALIQGFATYISGGWNKESSTVHAFTVTWSLHLRSQQGQWQLAYRLKLEPRWGRTLQKQTHCDRAAACWVRYTHEWNLKMHTCDPILCLVFFLCLNVVDFHTFKCHRCWVWPVYTGFAIWLLYIYTVLGLGYMTFFYVRSYIPFCEIEAAWWDMGEQSTPMIFPPWKFISLWGALRYAVQ